MGEKVDYAAQKALDAVYDPPRFRKFLYNVQTTIEVISENEDDALEILNDCGGRLIDRDVLLVEVEPFGAEEQ